MLTTMIRTSITTTPTWKTTIITMNKLPNNVCIITRPKSYKYVPTWSFNVFSFFYYLVFCTEMVKIYTNKYCINIHSVFFFFVIVVNWVKHLDWFKLIITEVWQNDVSSIISFVCVFVCLFDCNFLLHIF